MSTRNVVTAPTTALSRPTPCARHLDASCRRTVTGISRTKLSSKNTENFVPPTFFANHCPKTDVNSSV